MSTCVWLAHIHNTSSDNSHFVGIFTTRELADAAIHERMVEMIEEEGDGYSYAEGLFGPNGKLLPNLSRERIREAWQYMTRGDWRAMAEEFTLDARVQMEY